MQALTLRGDCDPSSLEIALDKDNNRAVVQARISDEQIQTAHLEFNFQDMSASLLNSSDIGVVVDNLGVTTIHILKVEGDLSAQALVLKSPNGTLFRYTPDDSGNLIPQAI